MAKDSHGKRLSTSDDSDVGGTCEKRVLIMTLACRVLTDIMTSWSREKGAKTSNE